MTVHSYAIRFDQSALFAPQNSIQIGPYFRLQPVIPKRDLYDVFEKFENPEDYGKFAPFRDQICCELVADEADWASLRGEAAEVFSELPADERLDIITGHANAIILLMRLCGMTHFTVPLELSESTFQNLRFQEKKSVSIRFRFSQAVIYPIIGPNAPKLLDEQDIAWITDNHLKVMKMDSSGKFTFLHDLFEILNFPNPSIQLVQIWAGIESIVKSQPKRTKHSIRARCAMFLCETKKERQELYDALGPLYNFRCDVVHGNKSFSMKEWLEGFEDQRVTGKTKKLFESFTILKRLMIKVIEAGEMPTRKKLLALQSEFEEME